MVVYGDIGGSKNNFNLGTAIDDVINEYEQIKVQDQLE